MNINVYDQILSLDDNDTIEEMAAHTHMTVSELKKYILDIIKRKENY